MTHSFQESMPTDTMLTLSHELQSWRPDQETIALNAALSPIYGDMCSKCADWHAEDDGHSWTDKDNV